MKTARKGNSLVSCIGEAHSNPNIDHCALCAPRWGVIEVPRLAPASEALFLELARDACNWSGTPMISVTKAQKGNLTDLKLAKLLTTFVDDGVAFASFTNRGAALAAHYGVTL